MKLALQIAWRFLTSAKRQTLIIILGISVGVSVQVFIGSLIAGLQDSLVDATIGSSSHITLVAQDDTELLFEADDKLLQIDAFAEAIRVASPVINMGGTVKKDLLEKEILLRGFEFDRANAIYRFDEKIVSGRLPQNEGEVALGITLGAPNQLDIQINDTIDVTILGHVHTLKVVGFFDFRVAIINRTWAISTLSTVQTILDAPNQWTAVEYQIVRVFEAETLAAEMDTFFASRALKTTNWMSENQELLSGLNGQSISSLMIQVFVIISVVLGISSTLAITVMQKSKQIGILKAMGILDRDASRIFLFEGMILGVFGAIGGVLLGLGLSYMFSTFALNPDGTPVIPLSINGQFILLSGMIAIVASTLAALLPALKSSQMTVIEVIRNA